MSARTIAVAEISLTMQETCALFEKSEGRIRQLARSHKIATVDFASPVGNGVAPRKYLLSSFPAAIQAKYAMQSKNSLAITPFAGPTLPLFAALPEVPEPVRVQLDGKGRKEADRWLDAITQFNDLTQRAEDGKPLRLADGKVLEKKEDIAEHVAAQMNPPRRGRSLYRYIERFTSGKKRETGGYVALARKIRRDALGAGSRCLDAFTKAYLEKKYLLKEEGELSMYMSWEALVRDWSKVLGQKGDAPKYGTVRKYLKGLSKGLKTLARVGPEAYVSQCSPFIIRGKQPVMKTWVSDHRVHDVLVRNRMFAEKKCDEAYRMQFTGKSVV